METGSGEGSPCLRLHPALISFVSNSFMQQGELSTSLRERLAALEQENAMLRSQLDDCQRSHVSQAQVAALEKDYAAQLAEQARQLAIAREQEQAAQARAAELEKANVALRDAIAGVAHLNDLDQFLSQMLKAALKVSGAHSGVVVLIEGDFVRHAVLFEKAGLVSSSDQAARGLLRTPFSPELREMAQRILEAEDAWVVYPDEPIHPSSFQQFHREQGNRAIRLVPMRICNRLLGWLGLGFAEQEPPLGRSFTLLRLLAEQMTMAVEMLRLAEEAKQAAIAREQEKAAQERAAELVKANDALRRSLNTLATDIDLSRFIGHVLKVVADCLDSPLTEYWWHSPDRGNQAFVGLTCLHGQILTPIEQPGHPGGNGLTIQLEDVNNEPLHQRKRYFIREDFLSDPFLELYSREAGVDIAQWYVSKGVRKELNIPLIVGDRCIGAICAHYPLERNFRETQIELGYALAQQLALAIQLHELAEEAKQAAIAREQEKAAQKRAAELVKANEALQAEVIVRQRAELALRESERRFRAIYEQAAVGIAITSLNGRWLQVNERFCDIVGYTQSELLSLTFQDITVPEAIPADLDAIPRLISGELHQRQVEKQYIRKDGSLVWVYLTISVARDDAGAAICFIVIIQDISQRKRAELVSEGQKLALQRTLDFLATEPELDRFLGQVLITVTQQLGASIADLWLNDVDRDLTWLYLTCQYGQILAAADQPNHPGANPVRISDFHHRQSWQCLNVQHQTYIYYDVCNHPCEALRSWAITHDGVQMVLLVPLVLGDRHLGTLMIGERENRLYQAEELELARVLAQQVVLAIQLTRLAEEARQTAIAREQEQAARERAGELVKANEVLRRSVNALNTQPSIEAFLSITLHSIATVLQVPYACLWHYEGEWAYLQWVYQDEAVLPAAKSSHPNATQPIALGNDAYDPDRRLRTRPYYYATNDPINALPLKHRVMFQQLGVRCLLVAPIAVGDQAIGSISIRITQDMPDPTPIQIELVSTLANQAALAIQMADLAEQAKQTALLEERTRLAGEIHDTLAQAFTGISIQLGVAQRIEDHNPGEVKQILAQANALAQKGLAEARRSVWALYPDAAEYKDLAIALPRCIRQLATHANVAIEVTIHGTPYPVSAMVGMNLLRVGQEAVLNALNHANAETIWVDLDFESDQVCLKIRDDGRGFVLPTDDCGVSGGFGLLSMNQRTERMGGRLTIISELARGTEIVVQVPFSL